VRNGRSGAPSTANSSPGDLVFDVGANVGNRVEASLSVEYNPSLAHLTEQCIRLLSVLGAYRFAYSPGESMALDSRAGWMTGEYLLTYLESACGPPIRGLMKWSEA
jgi:hypothetical protein